MRQKRTISSYTLLIGILGLLIAGSWLAYDLYGAIVKSQITAEQEMDILPLSDKLNEKALVNLKQRKQFSEAELREINSINYEEVKKTEQNKSEQLFQASEAAKLKIADQDKLIE